MIKTPNKRMRSTLPAIGMLLTFIAAYFLYTTIPRPVRGYASTIVIRFLPPGEWGVGYYCADSPTHPQSGYTYGPVRVLRMYSPRN